MYLNKKILEIDLVQIIKVIFLIFLGSTNILK